MRSGSSPLSAVVTLIALVLALVSAGCGKRVGVGGAYSIYAPANPDGQRHGNALYFNGTKVCENVWAEQYNAGVLVFMRYLQNSQGPQLFAVSGAGPSVMLSGRIVTDPRAFSVPTMSGTSQPGVNYHLESLSPTPNGVRAHFYVATDENTGASVFEDHDLTWPEIAQLIQQANTTGVLRQDKSGDYLFLDKAPTPTTQP